MSDGADGRSTGEDPTAATADDAGTDTTGADAATPPEVARARSITTVTGTVTVGGSAPAPPVAAAPGTSWWSRERRRARREAYWSRPKPPKDWRYWVGGVGRALIVLGLLMFAFVAYQLWGTGIEEARAQNRLENELEELHANLGTTPVLIPASTAPPTTAPPTGNPGTIVPPVTEPPVTQPPTLSLPPIAEGDAIGTLRIQRIGLEKTVVAGVTVADLKNGPGHFPQTPMPGELGNAAIAAHRTTFGGPFLHLDQLDVGDEIVFENLYQQQFVYRVTGTEVVNPSDGHVINTTDPDLATLTLVTCTPPTTSRQRLIIHAELDTTASPAPTATQRYYGQEGDAITELPGEDPGDAVDATGPEGTTLPGDAAGPATSVADGGSADRPAGFSDADPFAASWFSDGAAWPHVIGWGLGLVAVCVAAYLVARTLRRRWVGWVAGAVPFVVLLYFFFQNVNRLLPPGL